MSWLQRLAAINEKQWHPVGGIAGFVTLLGWFGVLMAWGWLARRRWLDRELEPH